MAAVYSNKRHSLNSIRPLHLLDGNTPTTSSSSRPNTPLNLSIHVPPSDISYSPSTPTTTNLKSARRQSSISYNPASSPGATPFTPRHAALGRSHSLSSPSPSPSPLRSNSKAPRTPNRSSTGSSELLENKERPPVTLAERHADLLHFIAQKESKCLELRSLLAMHEAELLQLKRKWERIVSRGFERPTANPSPHTGPITTTSISTNRDTHAPATGSVPGGGAMLEGIKEVSRFIAAGLGDFSPDPSPSSPITVARSSSASAPSAPRPTTITSTRASHSANSSASTYASKSSSARFSQSSASSIEEEASVKVGHNHAQYISHSHTHIHNNTQDKKKDEQEIEEEENIQVLMVHDTGATPTMSPNPAFMHMHQQQMQIQQTQAMGMGMGSAKLHRRKSRDVSVLEDREDRGVGDECLERDKEKEKVKPRTPSVNGAKTPTTPIPGLVSLVAPSSWVGSVGKKWEELQRTSTFTKNQKRASLLLSDVSQSIVSALSPPSTSSAAFHSTSSSTFHSSPISTSTPPAPFRSISTPSSTSTPSLLDDDDNDQMHMHMATAVMTPDTPTTATSRSNVHKDNSYTKLNDNKQESEDGDGDGDDEWNW